MGKETGDSEREISQMQLKSHKHYWVPVTWEGASNII